MSTALPAAAEVVVVGVGVIGTSVAFHIAEAGDDVSLQERVHLAGAIGLRSIEAFTRFGERPGAEIDLHQVGYLFLLDREEDVASFEEGVALQNEIGVPSRFVDLDEVAQLCPIAGLDGVLAATYCALDGHASPEAVVQGYAAGARSHGASVLTGCAVSRIVADEGHIRGVETALGTLETDTVVCASGVWSPELARTVDVDLPVEPYLREVGFTGPTPGLPDPLPLTVDFSTGLYFHREGPGLLFGMADPHQPAGLDMPSDPAWLERVMEVAERRLPSLLDMGIAGGWKGYYEPTRFLYATGFSGHGFLQGPAVGEIVRDLVLGNEPFVDVSPLSAERFAHATPRPEHNVI